MSRGPENRFIASVHRLLPLELYRMKNHNTYTGGIADVWYSGHREDAWIEYKYVEKLPLVVNLLDHKKQYALSALQEEWLRDRFEEGRNVFVVLGCKDGGLVFKQRRWEKPYCKETQDRDRSVEVFTRQEIAEWICMLTEGKYEVPVRSRKRIERCV